MTTYKLTNLNQLVIKKKGNKLLKPDIKPDVEAALKDPAVMAGVGEFMTNGGKRGHKVLDYDRAFSMIAKHNTEKGNGYLAAAKLDDWDKIQQMNVVFHRYFSFEKGRIVGLNLKRVTLISE